MALWPLRTCLLNFSNSSRLTFVDSNKARSAATLRMYMFIPNCKV